MRAVAEICRRLDGIPLAIELAAARVRAMSVEQIAARLDDRFRLLNRGDRTALPRQQTLRALIDWSHDLLDAKERALFRRLAVFAGGWTLEAAEAVGAGGDIAREDVLDLLSNLVEKSLVAMDAESGAIACSIRFVSTRWRSFLNSPKKRPLGNGTLPSFFKLWSGRCRNFSVLSKGHGWHGLIWTARMCSRHTSGATRVRLVLKQAYDWSLL